jgi:ankyrin repeat protein
MRLLKGATIAIALSMTAMVAAAPGGAAVADAVMKGNRDAVRTLLKEGADVNAAQGDGMTALHWAADRGDAETAEMLIYAGASVGAVTRIGAYTPLHLASRAGSAPVIKTLLKGGAEVDARTSTSGVTPLHLAAAAGNVEAITALLDNKADPNAKESEWQQTPLIFAASLNRVDAIKTLLAHGADPKAVTKTVDLAKQQALDRAATALQRKILDTTVPKGEKPTPNQMQAAIQAARELYASGKIPPPDPAAPAGGRGGRGGRGGGAPAGDPAPAPAGADPAAAAPANNTFINTSDDGPLPPISAKGGMTALLHAARQGNIEAATALVDGGADVNQVSASDQTSPLLMAVINGQFDMAMMLIKRGANPNLAAAINGATPLWAAINTQWQPRTRFPQPQELELQKATYLDVMKALLDAGADPNTRMKGHPWYLVYNGCGNANCGLTNVTGSTPFWRAAYGTDVEAMKLLMKYGADPYIPTIAPQARGGFGGRGGGGRGGGAPGQQPGQQPGQPAAAGPDGRGGGGGGPDVNGGQIQVGANGLDPSGLPTIPYGGPGVSALHAAAGVEYGEGFAGNAHRHLPGGWLPSVKYLVEELGFDVNSRDNDGYTPLHHAAARGDNEMIQYLVSKGADVKAISRKGQTTADMANGPVSRISPFPETIKLLESLGSKNNHRCQSC